MTSIYFKLGEKKHLMAIITLNEESRFINNIEVVDKMVEVFSTIWPSWENKSYYELEKLFQYYFNESGTGRELSEYILAIKHNGNEFRSPYEYALSISVF